MSLQDKAKEMMGKAQETLGKATGDNQLEAEGKVNQIEAQASQAIETTKEKASEIAQNLVDKAKEILG